MTWGYKKEAGTGGYAPPAPIPGPMFLVGLEVDPATIAVMRDVVVGMLHRTRQVVLTPGQRLETPAARVAVVPAHMTLGLTEDAEGAGG
ncbi:hypothetical protein LCGC14_2997680, partial [marine sediment metagenome]